LTAALAVLLDTARTARPFQLGDKAMASIRPTHKVLAVSERGEGQDVKSNFTKFGVAFPIKEGKGLSILLDALPVNSRLILLEFEEEEMPETSSKPARKAK